MKSICLINVFLGEFPWYFDFFLKSCRFNPTVNFLIFTNNSTSVNCPENVKIIPFSLDSFNKLASDKLNLTIKIERPYKLCDLKPAYGVIFSEYIDNYDYWGITDIDIVFGRIREFITEELLAEYEVVSVRNDYPTGSFMLFKNEEKINNLFRCSRDYIIVFTSQKHYCFDECAFEHMFLEEGGNIFDVETEIESMHHVLMKEMEVNNLRVHYDFLIIEGIPGKLYWNKGLLSFKNEFEVLNYHLILYKDNQYSLKANWKNIPDQFYIDRYFFRKKGILSKAYFFIIEKIRIIGLKKLILIENYISTKVCKKFYKSTANTLYVNGKYKRYITINKNGYSILLFSKSNAGHKLVNSRFRANVLFLENNKNIHYKLRKKDNLLIEIIEDGSTFKLVKV